MHAQIKGHETIKMGVIGTHAKFFYNHVQHGSENDSRKSALEQILNRVKC
jgi:hypothetical protein